jgi:hypothetical protein
MVVRSLKWFECLKLADPCRSGNGRTRLNSAVQLDLANGCFRCSPHAGELQQDKALLNDERRTLALEAARENFFFHNGMNAPVSVNDLRDAKIDRY